MESRKKFRLNLSLHLWNLVSFGFMNSILFYFVISYICWSAFQVCQCSLFQVISSIIYFFSLGHWGQCLVLVGGRG
jgi:Na+/melibiose symporter-like transporter